MKEPARPVPDSPAAGAMVKGRQADSARRRQRVLAALDRAAADGTEISVSGIARVAAVDRTFLYRTATSSRRSTPSRPGRRLTAAARVPPSPGHLCKPTCSPPTSAPSG